jgi:hypothetical protein
MVPTPCSRTSPVPPPAYHRMRAKVGRALHLDALTLVTCLHLLTLCRLAVRLAPLPTPGPSGSRRAAADLRRGVPVAACPAAHPVAPVISGSARLAGGVARARARLWLVLRQRRSGAGAQPGPTVQAGAAGGGRRCTKCCSWCSSLSPALPISLGDTT